MGFLLLGLRGHAPEYLSRGLGNAALLFALALQYHAVARFNGIARGRRAVSPETAQLLAAALGTTPEFWMNAQSSHDLATHRIHVHLRPLLKVG